MNAPSEDHSTVVRVLLLAVLLLSGYLESALLKQRELACVTWLVGLGALTVWVVYPLTIVRIGIGTLVLLSGVMLVAVYYRRTKEGG